MRGDATHVQLVSAAALPRGLDGSSGKRRLEHEDVPRCAALHLQWLAREVPLPISSSVVHSMTIRRVTDVPALEERTGGEHAHRDPGPSMLS